MMVTIDLVTGLAWWAHVSSSTFQTGADIAQLISIASLPLAAWAIVSAKRDLVRERRITFELDSLRALAMLGIARGNAGEEDVQETVVRIRGVLLTLTDNTDLPMTRAAVFADPTPQDLADFAVMCPDASAEDEWLNRG